MSDLNAEDVAPQRCYVHTFVTIDQCGCPPDPSLRPAESVVPLDVCPCCQFSRTTVVGQRCSWCHIAGCRKECRRYCGGARPVSDDGRAESDKGTLRRPAPHATTATSTTELPRERTLIVPMATGRAMRPSFNDYYLGIAHAVAARGDCSRARHGCVIVKGNRIVATGYNGTPPGSKLSCLNGDCPRSHLSLHECPPGSSYDTGPGACIATHAEANALLRASWEDLKGATLYVTGPPCGGCTRLIESAQIFRVVWG